MQKKTEAIESAPKVPYLSAEQKDKLLGQIGIYKPKSLPASPDQRLLDAAFVKTLLPRHVAQIFYHSALAYSKHYTDAVTQYRLKNPQSAQTASLKDMQFFRREFIQFIEAKGLNFKKYKVGEPDIRATDPEKATVKLAELFGQEGAALYQLALEEEAHSEAYMNAVLRASHKNFPGETWVERPIIIVAGPSACGKTMAAEAVVEKAKDFLPKKKNENKGNDIVFVDGGILREVSQMRKLVVQCATKQGFSGVSDLHDKSKVLDQSRKDLRRTVFATPALGAVIPETFSSLINSTLQSHALLKEIQGLPTKNLPPAITLFCRVKGENSALFQEVVAFMGSRRALKTENFDNQPAIDLHAENLTESKIYNEGAFRLGQNGSRQAEKWFKGLRNENLSMVVTNDLLLKREVPKGSHNWVDAHKGDKGTVLVSRRVFEDWEALREKSIREYNKATLSGKSGKITSLLPLEEYRDKNKRPPLIQNSTAVNLAVAKKAVAEELKVVFSKMNSDNAELLRPKHEALNLVLLAINLIAQKDNNDLTKGQIATIRSALGDCIRKYKVSYDNAQLFREALSALQRAENVLPVSGKNQTTSAIQGSGREDEFVIIGPDSEEEGSYPSPESSDDEDTSADLSSPRTIPGNEDGRAFDILLPDDETEDTPLAAETRAKSKDPGLTEKAREDAKATNTNATIQQIATTSTEAVVKAQGILKDSKEANPDGTNEQPTIQTKK